jgi:hypothetical protein
MTNSKKMSASRNSRFRAVQSSGKLLVWRSAQQAVCFRFPGRWPEARTRDAQFKPSKANSIFSPPNPSRDGFVAVSAQEGILHRGPKLNFGFNDVDLQLVALDSDGAKRMSERQEAFPLALRFCRRILPGGMGQGFESVTCHKCLKENET